MDRRPWFIDFARRKGRERLNAYFVAVIKSIRYCDHVLAKQIDEIDNAIRAFDEAFYDESLPWDTMDTKKPSAPTESPKKIHQPDCTINLAKVEPFVDREMAEEVLRNEG